LLRCAVAKAGVAGNWKSDFDSALHRYHDVPILVDGGFDLGVTRIPLRRTFAI
jgi:hypothetical protein